MTVLDRFRLDDKVVVVTGASSGLGSPSRRPSPRPAPTSCSAPAGSTGCPRPASWSRPPAAGYAYAADRRRRCPEQATALVQKAVDEFGRVDVLVNNAGLGWAKPATRETPAEFLRVVDVNLNGAYWCAQAFGRLRQGRRLDHQHLQRARPAPGPLGGSGCLSSGGRSRPSCLRQRLSSDTADSAQP